MPNSEQPPPEALRAAFGKTVRTLRKREGISQEKLAQQAQINRGYMGELERGKHSPSLDTIWRILLVLKCSFPDFADEYEIALRNEIVHPPKKNRRR